MNIQQRLRNYNDNFLAIEELSEMLNDAAYRIDFLEAKIRYLESMGPSLKELMKTFKDIPEISGKLPK